MTTKISVLSNFSSNRAPEEYAVDRSTTTRDLVKLVLTRHCLLSKDPRLLYVTLDTLSPRGVTQSSELSPDATLLQRLQASNAKSRPGQSHIFVLHMRPGGLLKIHDACIMPGSFYNSLYVSMETTTAQVIALLLASYGSNEPPSNFHLVAKDARGRVLRQLQDSEECPLEVQQHYQQQQQRQSRRGREAEPISIHLKRSGVAAADPEASATTPRRPVIATCRSDTLARLQASFRELQRLRERNPGMYDRLVVAARPAATASRDSDHDGANRQPKGGQAESGFHSARLQSSRLAHLRPGNLSARGPTGRQAPEVERHRDYWRPVDGSISSRRDTRMNFLAAIVGENDDNDPGSFDRQHRVNQSARGYLQSRHRHQHPMTHLTEIAPAKRQLPQVPLLTHNESSVEVSRDLKEDLKLNLDQRTVVAHSIPQRKISQQRDTESQTEPELPDNHRHPSLREIIASHETHSCHVMRPSRASSWGLRWQEVEFGGDVNGNNEQQEPSVASVPTSSKPAIGRRQGAFQRNERLLGYMRTLVALQSVTHELSAASGLRPGDLLLEVNGLLATGMTLEQVDRLMESQLTLELLIARRPSYDSEEEDYSEDAGGKFKGANQCLQLQRLQQQCNDLASQCRVNEQVIQRLRAQLAKTAPLCLLQHTPGLSNGLDGPNGVKRWSMSHHVESARNSFRVISSSGTG